MASGLSKRHQARNEKALQELIKTVPGNDRCADCSARNPGWASWSLGIFLCMRCAALHRKLGTHVSKVKSLSMDSWSVDQVDNMKRMGNVASNKIYNPHNTKPRVPADADEIDSALERFIRQKYEQKAYAEGAAPVRSATVQSYTGMSSASRDTEDKPPTPPPKPSVSKRFGFGLRSSSSTIGLSRKKDTSRKSSVGPGTMFGAAIGVTSSNDGMQWKLVTLKEMGFSDEQRNSNVLKGVNGDLDRAVESLVRLGEGNGTVQTPTSSHFSSRKNTPPIESRFEKAVTGASVQWPAEQQSQAAKPSQTASQTVSPTTSSHSYNPFENIQPSQGQQTGLNSAMQNLNLGLGQQPQQQQQHQQQQQQQPQVYQQPQQAQPQQLFPNTTGGYTNNQDPWQQMRLQQSMTPPPVPQVPQQFNYNNPYTHQQQNNYSQFAANNQLPPSPSSTNPFVSQHSTGSTNPFMNLQTNNINAVFSPPFSGQQEPTQNIYTQQQAQQAQQVQQTQAQPQQQYPQLQTQPQQSWMSQSIQNSPTHYSNPQQFPQAAQSAFNNNMTFPGSSQQQPQALAPQQTGRFDKSSILALYNYPQLAPQQPQQQPQANENGTVDNLNASPQPPAAAKLPRGYTPGGRSATMPVSSGSKNPFARPGIPQMTPSSQAVHHGPQESIDGRHSPDAFASLSARFVR